MQKTLKISVLDKVYTITTDEDEQCVVRAMSRVNQMLDHSTKLGANPTSDIGRNIVLPLLQLALELEKALVSLQETDMRISSLEKLISTSL